MKVAAVALLIDLVLLLWSSFVFMMLWEWHMPEPIEFGAAIGLVLMIRVATHQPADVPGRVIIYHYVFLPLAALIVGYFVR